MKRALKTRLWPALLVLILAGILPTPSLSQTYVRGGVSLDRGDDTRFRDADCSSQSPAALYGCGMGNDGAPLSSLGDFGAIAGIELGLGYAIVPYLRLEAALQYRPNFSFSGDANFTQPAPDARQDVSADLSSLSGMLAAYIDISELLLFQHMPVGPFVGVGGGLSEIEIGQTRMNFPKTTTIVPGGRQMSFAWMLSAGIGVSLGGRLTVDVAWRYTDHGEIETSSGAGRVVWRDGSREPSVFDLAGTKARLRSHGLVVSMRYAF